MIVTRMTRGGGNDKRTKDEKSPPRHPLPPRHSPPQSESQKESSPNNGREKV